MKSNPILRDTEIEKLSIGGSLYKVAPLNEQAEPLLFAAVAGRPAEPILWTFRRSDGGKSVYTSLGHEREFQQSSFVRLLENSIQWALAP